MAADEMKKIIKAADYLKRGAVNYSEFMMATINLKEQLTDQLLMDTFMRFDTDRSGRID